MPWPTPQDYNEAVQNPRLAFADADLRCGQAEVDGLGLPRPRCGAFACVYKMECPGRAWATKCFTSEVIDQQERYEEIDRHLAEARLPYMVGFGYQARGLKVKGGEYPLLKMEWVKGDGLSSFVGNNLGSPAVLTALAERWMQMMKVLQQAKVAHGDLQDRNVLVVGGELRLVDYDGMFVPALEGRISNEIGQRNYQHPERNSGDYGPYLDNFSGWVIYASLVALSEMPELWRKHQGGDECLIFRRADFEAPDASAVLQDLRKSTNANVRALGDFIARLPRLPVWDIPAVEVGRGAAVGSGATAASGGAGQEWWKDHVGAEPATKEKEPDVDWILENIGGTTERANFRGPFGAIRFTVGSSFAALLVTGYLTGLPASGFLWLGLGVLGTNVVVLFVNFLRDPTRVEWETFRERLARLESGLEDRRQERKVLEGKRAEAVAKTAAAQAEWSAKRRKAGVELEEQLGSLQVRMGSVLRLLHERRRSIAEREGAEMRGLKVALSERIDGLERQIIGLAGKENDERSQALEALRKAHIDGWMRAYRIDTSYLSGIGPANAASLASRGFATAADLYQQGLLSVPGIGPKRAGVLTGWRDRVRTQAEARAPASLPDQDVRRITTKFAAERVRLCNEKSGLEARLQAETSSVRAKHASEKDGVERDERAQRASNAQEGAALRQRYAQEAARLDREAQEARSKSGAALAEATERLRGFDKGFAAQRWTCEKEKRRAARYEGLGFWSYVGAVCRL